jgi:hypothetical protein
VDLPVSRLIPASCLTKLSGIETNATRPLWDYPDKHARVSYSMAEVRPQYCTLQVGVSLLSAVTITNLVKAITMYTTSRNKHRPLLTIGDAISSSSKIQIHSLQLNVAYSLD